MVTAARTIVACVVLSLVAGATGSLVAAAATRGGVINAGQQLYGCLDPVSGALALNAASDECQDGLLPVTWSAGAAGADGSDGMNGADGADGAAGAAGSDGADGRNGSAGAPGATGAAGADGAAGANGTDGEDGLDGSAGAPGADGATGPAGADGATGPAGADGATGPAGADGATGPAGADGATGPAGADGATGPAGADGATGATGATPWSTVGAWDTATPYTAGPPASVVTFNGSTYVAARSSLAADPQSSPADWILIAMAGAQGPKGDPGETGATGATGPTGATGATGSPGATGAAGPAGATGPEGPAGAEGPAGPEGNSFLRGLLGVKDYTSSTAPVQQECVIGTITLTAGAYAPGVPADGRVLDIASYELLYRVIGNAYDRPEDEPKDTFRVPDLRPVAPVGLTYSVCDQGIFPDRG